MNSQNIQREINPSALPSATGPIVFDIETQFLAKEIPGGWSNLPGLKLACAVVYDVEQERYFTYVENQVQNLIHHLKISRLVIGFNTLGFDYKVLQGYTTVPLQTLPSLDLMDSLYKILKHRLSLAHLAQYTLGGAEKMADGVLAVQWWREGKHDQVIQYCQQDVKLTYDLWQFGKEKGYILFQKRSSEQIEKCSVHW